MLGAGVTSVHETAQVLLFTAYTLVGLNFLICKVLNVVIYLLCLEHLLSAETGLNDVTCILLNPNSHPMM